MQTVIPTLLYAAEKWTTIKAMESKIRSTQLSMERKMLGISWKDRIKEKTKLPDVLQMLKTSKWVFCLKLFEIGHQPQGQKCFGKCKSFPYPTTT